MRELTDEEIAIWVQSGSDESFEILMRRYEERLTRFGRKFLSVDEDIEDMVQEVFIKAFVGIQSFDHRQKFSSWIYRIAHNQYVDALKKKGRERVSYFDLDVFFPHAIAPETTGDETEREELKKILDRFLNKLKSKYREPLILFYFEEMGYKEISDILQIPVATVGMRLQRGKTMMKKIFQESGESNE
jgi:RNA polymerase sigma-70 factor, ECF subfamily